MGLDISAVSNLVKVEIPEGIKPWTDDYYDWESDSGLHLWFYSQDNQPAFIEQGEGLEAGAYDGQGETYGFRAGSYTGYGMWRDELAYAAGYYGGDEEVWGNVDSGGYEGRPFEELINFSDADGWIGPVVSKKLYQDFVNNEKKIMDTIDKWVLMQGHPDYTPGFLQKSEYKNKEKDEPRTYDMDDVKWFRMKYQDWKKAFELASNNGAVIFH